MKLNVNRTSNKGLGKLQNEDYIGSFKSFFWIMDGATVPKNLSDKINIKASWFVKEFSSKLVEIISLDPEISLSDLTRKALITLKPKITSNKLDAILPCATFIIIKCEKDVIKYLVLGDSTLLYQDSYNYFELSDKRLEDIASQIRIELIELLKESMNFNSDAYNILLEKLVVEERKNLNKSNGFWMLSDSTEAVEKSLLGTIPIQGESFKVLLMTDGFSRIVDTYNQYSSFLEFISGLDNGNLKGVITKIRSIERKDKMGQIYPRISPSDDASAIIISSK